MFAALYGVRFLLLRAHSYFLNRKKLWVLAEDEGTARRLASKVMAEGQRYEVISCSNLPESDALRSLLEGCDAVLCTSGLRGAVEPLCNEKGKQLLIVPGASEVLLYNAGAQKFDDLLVLSLPPFQLTSMQRFLKRLTDVAGAAFLLFLCAPIMAALALIIPLDAEGPAIFRQERRGLRGRSFEVLKFRTMYADAEQLSGPVLASRGDPRITRLGRILRATRLDELPQLWNVLKGEMSLVGPRPEREFFARRFEGELPDYRLRSTVKPGLTGLAQVWGSYSTVAEAKLRLDLMYIANYSLLLDVNLLVHTVRVVLQRRQAAGLDPAAGLRFGFQAEEKRREA
jgi:exopolysaccharide biosynthesis polyprenyl glycosylphosphotransferase